MQQFEKLKEPWLYKLDVMSYLNCHIDVIFLLYDSIKIQEYVYLFLILFEKYEWLFKKNSMQITRRAFNLSRLKAC